MIIGTTNHINTKFDCAGVFLKTKVFWGKIVCEKWQKLVVTLYERSFGCKTANGVAIWHRCISQWVRIFFLKSAKYFEKIIQK